MRRLLLTLAVIATFAAFPAIVDLLADHWWIVCVAFVGVLVWFDRAVRDLIDT